MSRPKGLIFPALFALLGIIVTGFLWLNNLISAWHYHQMLYQGQIARLSSVSGICPQLDWSAVDVSTVTTFIPFFGLLVFFCNWCRPNENENWPFFAGYNRFNIALGLLGTIWGIILIGYFPTEEISIAALMRCLHTAMFSTLAAVAWVMVILPAIILPLSQKLKPHTQKSTPEADSLEDFLSELQAITAALHSGTAAAQKFQAAGENLQQMWHREREVAQAQQQQQTNTLTQLAAVTQQLVAQQDTITQQNAQLTQINAQLQQELKAARQELQQAQQQLDTIKNVVR